MSQEKKMGEDVGIGRAGENEFQIGVFMHDLKNHGER
jgi:hypothetical protein